MSPGVPGVAAGLAEIVYPDMAAPAVPTLPTIPFAFAVPVALFLVLWLLFYYPLAGVGGLARKTAKLAGALVGRSRLGKWAVARSEWAGLRSYAPVIMLVVVGGFAAIWAGYLFISLAVKLRLTTSSIYHADQAVHEWILNARQPGLTAILETITYLGNGVSLIAVIAIATTILFVKKRPASAVFVLIAALGGLLLNLVLKMMFARARPDMASAVTVAKWYSFPSGHAMGSFAVYGTLAYTALRQNWRWKLKSACLAIAVTLIVLIGLSRVYLGVHWTSDIAGGWTAATVWLATTTVAFEMVVRRRRQVAAENVPAVGVPST